MDSLPAGVIRGGGEASDASGGPSPFQRPGAVPPGHDLCEARAEERRRLGVASSRQARSKACRPGEDRSADQRTRTLGSVRRAGDDLSFARPRGEVPEVRAPRGDVDPAQLVGDGGGFIADEAGMTMPSRTTMLFIRMKSAARLT